MTERLLLSKLRELGERITPVRRTLIKIFLQNKRPLTSAELIKLLHNKKIPVNKTTVYRQLEELVKIEMVDEIRLGRSASFELRRDHHHHLLCTSCGQVWDFSPRTDLQKEEKYILKKKNFLVERHALEFFGRCVKCQKSA